MRKYVKSYRKIFFYLVDIALFNAYVLFCKKIDMPKSKKYSFEKFRLDMTEQILQNICIPNYQTRGRMSNDNTPHRLTRKQWAFSKEYSTHRN